MRTKPPLVRALRSAPPAALPRFLTAALVCSLLGLTACGKSDDDQQTDPTAVRSSSTALGPFDIAPGEEKTVCILKRLDNPEELLVSQLTVDLAPVSHHLVIYRSNADEERLTPFPCRPFEGIVLGIDLPILIATSAHVEYAMPKGVGMAIEKGQMLKIEAHYLNPGTAMAQGSAKISVAGRALATAGDYAVADIGVWGTTRFNIPPQGEFETPMKFQAGLPGTHAFALITHQHRLGTRARVWASAGPDDDSRLLADDRTWSDPALTRLDPQIDFDGKNGLGLRCAWANPGDDPVHFGEGALDEMCFVILYYYPSRGVDVCLDGRCGGRR